MGFSPRSNDSTQSKKMYATIPHAKIRYKAAGKLSKRMKTSMSRMVIP
jgi:hypothetical protein